MQTVGQLLAAVGGLGSLVCFIIVVVRMFQNGHTGLGIACVLLTCVCGIGGLIAYVFGWMRSRDWNLQTVMLIWTVCIIIAIIGNVMNPVDYSQFQGQFPARP